MNKTGWRRNTTKECGVVEASSTDSDRAMTLAVCPHRLYIKSWYNGSLFSDAKQVEQRLHLNVFNIQQTWLGLCIKLLKSARFRTQLRSVFSSLSTGIEGIEKVRKAGAAQLLDSLARHVSMCSSSVSVKHHGKPSHVYAYNTCWAPCRCQFCHLTSTLPTNWQQMSLSPVRPRTLHAKIAKGSCFPWRCHVPSKNLCPVVPVCREPDNWGNWGVC